MMDKFLKKNNPKEVLKQNDRILQKTSHNYKAVTVSYHNPKTGKTITATAKNGTAHFFLDDYRFERCWKNADSQLAVLKQYEGVLSPDFSMYTTYPLAFQIWQVYRNRWCARYWQQNGIKVIPTVSWSDESSYKYAFLGLEKNSTVAVSTLGILNYEENRKLFMQGFEEMLKQLEPKHILIYGNRLRNIASDATKNIIVIHWIS